MEKFLISGRRPHLVYSRLARLRHRLFPPKASGSQHSPEQGRSCAETGLSSHTRATSGLGPCLETQLLWL